MKRHPRCLSLWTTEQLIACVYPLLLCVFLFFCSRAGVVSFALYLLQPVIETGDLFLVFEVREEKGERREAWQARQQGRRACVFSTWAAPLKRWPGFCFPTTAQNVNKPLA